MERFIARRVRLVWNKMRAETDDDHEIEQRTDFTSKNGKIGSLGDVSLSHSHAQDTS